LETKNKGGSRGKKKNWETGSTQFTFFSHNDIIIEKKKTPIAVRKPLIGVLMGVALFFFELVVVDEDGDWVLDDAAEEVVEPPVIVPASLHEMDEGIV